MLYDHQEHSCILTQKEVEEQLELIRGLNWEDKMAALAISAIHAKHELICRGCMTRAMWQILITEQEREPNIVFTEILANITPDNTPVDKIKEFLNKKD